MSNPTTDNQNAANGSLREQIRNIGFQGKMFSLPWNNIENAIVDLITDTVEHVIGLDEPANRPSPDFLIGQSDAEINNELRAEQRQTLQRIIGRTG